MRILRLGLTRLAIPAAWAYFTGDTSGAATAVSATADSMIPVSAETEAIDQNTLEKSAADAGSFIDSKQADDSSADIRSFRKDFEKLLKDSDIRLLVVLIDDLDRCSPERIIENLEAIKLFLNVENTAFIIGADPRIVRHAIAQRYRDVGITSNQWRRRRK